MHISEGVLNAPVLLTGAAVTVIGTGIGLKKMDYDNVMTTALLTATFFVASLIHVPVGPGNVHLVLTGLLGIILGWSCFPAILIALILQSLFFSFGGLTVLGANVTIMALPALVCHYVFIPNIKKGGKAQKLAGFGAGFFSILFSALFMAGALSLSDSGFIATAKMIVAMHIPIMILEGFITMFAVSFLAKVKPELITSHKP